MEKVKKVVGNKVVVNYQVVVSNKGGKEVKVVNNKAVKEENKWKKLKNQVQQENSIIWDIHQDQIKCKKDNSQNSRTKMIWI